MPEIPCHGNVFHIQQQFSQVASGLARQAQGATTRSIKIEQQISKASVTNRVTQKMIIQQVQANRREAELHARARDVKTLSQWFAHDVLTLLGDSGYRFFLAFGEAEKWGGNCRSPLSMIYRWNFFSLCCLVLVCSVSIGVKCKVVTA